MRTERNDRASPHRAERRRLPFSEAFAALSLVLLITSIMPGATAASPAAHPTGHPVVGMANCNGNATCDLTSTLSNIQYFLIAVAVAMAGIAMAIYGISFMTGAIDEMPPEKRQQRKKQFFEIVVGLVLVLLSVAIVAIAKGLVNTS